MNSKRIRNTYISTLVCKNCGHIATVPRKEFQKRKIGHIKTMYCPRCKDMSDFNERTYGMTLAEKEDVV